MKGYVKRALQEFQHPTPTKIYDGPELFTPPEYGQKQQIEHIDQSPVLDAKQVNNIQKICGKFLCITRTIDNTMMHALNNIISTKKKGTQTT